MNFIDWIIHTLHEFLIEKPILVKLLMGIWEFVKTIIFPLIIFFAGLHFADIIKKREKRNDQTELKRYFIMISDLECSITKLQAIEYRNCVERIKKFETEDVKVTPIIGLPIEAYNSINKKNLFFAYAVKDSENLPTYFSNILTHFAYINEAYLRLPAHENKFIDDISPLIDEFNQHNIVFRRNISSLLDNSKLNTKYINNDKFLNDLDLIWRTYSEKESENRIITLNDIYDELILKMYEFSSTREDPRKNVFIEELILWKQCYKQIEAHYSSYEKFLTNSANNLDIAVKEIKSNLFFLDNPPLLHKQF